MPGRFIGTGLAQLNFNMSGVGIPRHAAAPLILKLNHRNTDEILSLPTGLRRQYLLKPWTVTRIVLPLIEPQSAGRHQF
ncbi:MAG: hypothetical protein R3E89_05660 [Thiolinea sp.]